MSAKTWYGNSGKAYEFNVYSWGADLLEIGGIYIVVNDDGIIYVGETENFNERISSSHHKYDCIIGKAPTEIHVHYQRNEKIQRVIESDILEKHNTG